MICAQVSTECALLFLRNLFKKPKHELRLLCVDRYYLPRFDEPNKPSKLVGIIVPRTPQPIRLKPQAAEPAERHCLFHPLLSLVLRHHKEGYSTLELYLPRSPLAKSTTSKRSAITVYALRSRRSS